MSSLPIFLRTGRMLLVENSAFNVKHTPMNRYPTYSSFRSIWSTLVRRKEAAADTQTTESNTSTPLESEAQTQIDDLLKALKELEENRNEIQEKYKRSLAENENIRKRFQKQIEDAQLYSIQKFCKDIIEVEDILSKATECVPKEEVNDSNPHLKNLYEGVTMTENVLKSVFSRHGLQLLNPIGEKFDPNFHEALFQQEVEGEPAGTVVVVSKQGYTLHGRVIRPALVGVSK